MEGIEGIKMEIGELVFGCDFCSDKFSTQFDRKEHTLTHFIRKSCWGCDVPLIKIADDWFMEHDERQCIINNQDENNTSANGEENFSQVQMKTEKSNMLDCECNEVNEPCDNSVDHISSVDLWRNSSSDDGKSTSGNAHVEFESESGSTAHTLKSNHIHDRTKEEQAQPTVQSELCENPMLKQDNINSSVQLSLDEMNRMRERLTCPICQQILSTPSNMRKHMKIHSKKGNTRKTRSKVPKCTVCSRVFARVSQLRPHMRTHTGEKPYKCDIDRCRNAFRYNKDLERHKYTVHGIYTRKFPCPICERVLPENRLLKKHMGIAHPEWHPDSEEEDESDDSNDNKNVSRIENSLSENAHSEFNSNEPPSIDESNPETDRTQTTKHRIGTKKKKKNKCTICKRKFATPSNMRKHMKIHSNPKARGDLKDNLVALKSEVRYKCNICSREFLRNGQLKPHMRTHTGEMPFQCDIDQCQRLYRYKIDLQRHEYSAHGIYHKKCPCPICGQIFPENIYLKKHMRTAHPEVDSGSQVNKVDVSDDSHKRGCLSNVDKTCSLFYSENSMSENAHSEYNGHTVTTTLQSPNEIKQRKDRKLEIQCHICNRTMQRGSIHNHMRFVHKMVSAKGDKIYDI